MNHPSVHGWQLRSKAVFADQPSSFVLRLRLALLALLMTVGATFVASNALGHGSMEFPPSRSYACRFLQPDHVMCQQAWDANPQALYDWMEINLADAGDRHREMVPDGRLCSAGREKYAAFDEASADWPTTEIQPDTDGRFTFRFNAWVPHSTLYYRIYITRDGWDPSIAVGWDDLDLVYDSGPWAAVDPVILRPTLPARSGQHLLYLVWQRDDSQEAFYSCSDVVFGAGTTGNPPPPEPPAADIDISLETSSDWGTGYCATAHITTTSTSRVDWTVTFTLLDTITSVWNADVVQDGSSVTAEGHAWNNAVSASEPQSFGFCADRTGTPPPPPPPPGNEPPVAALTVSPSGGPAPLAVVLDASGSMDPDGAIVEWAIDADGDGTPESVGADAFATHVYDTVGTREARVTVTDDAGSTATTTATVVVTGVAPPPPPPPPAGGIATPLSTSGRDIVDQNGGRVILRGVNWFGFETETHLAHGLWTRDYDEMLAQIAALGYDTIRLPFSLEAIDSSAPVSPSTAAGMNAALVGKTPLEAMDVIIDAAARHGLLILLDNHSLADDDHTFGLWFGGGYSEADWIARWEMLASRWADRSNVIGADLKNEPHGQANWGLGDEYDWRLAAERAGNAVHAFAPHWLIVVEGVEGSAVGQTLSRHWWGGNLEGVATHPVRLNIPNKLVYSPHEYGPGVHQQPWFDPYDPAVLEDRWQRGFNFIATEGIAPILVGEFGGREVGTDTVEGRWQNQFVDFLGREGHSFTYWSWNPNSGDTGGILTADWITVDQAKQDMLSRLLSGEVPPPAPTPSPAPPGPTPSPVPPAPTPSPAPPSGEVEIDVVATSDWGEGYCANVTVTAESSTPVDWRVTFPIDGTVRELWSATWSQAGDRVTAEGLSWNATVTVGRPATFGFCADR